MPCSVVLIYLDPRCNVSLLRWKALDDSLSDAIEKEIWSKCNTYFFLISFFLFSFRGRKARGKRWTTPPAAIAKEKKSKCNIWSLF